MLTRPGRAAGAEKAAADATAAAAIVERSICVLVTESRRRNSSETGIFVFLTFCGTVERRTNPDIKQKSVSSRPRTRLQKDTAAFRNPIKQVATHPSEYSACLPVLRPACVRASCFLAVRRLTLVLSLRMLSKLFDLEDYAGTYRETRNAYLKAANQLKLATGPYKAARDAYVAATATYTKSLYE